MLTELEQGLVAWLQTSPLAARLRRIEALPDLGEESLVAKFGADAPALYLAVGSGDMAKPGLAEPRIGIACVTRNSRGSQAARQGDGTQIGLLELIDAVSTLLDGALIDGHPYQVLRWDMVTSDALYRKGLYAAVVQVRTQAPLALTYTGDEA